ncbi:MAG: endolytic transglycosylase MltG [Burkholderiaceae bacterium]|nr:endolytic transglycosylase MltG [Burkholderiaceae bacterium]
MAAVKKLLALLALLVLAAVAFAVHWAREPLMPADAPALEFNIAPGSSVRSAMRQVRDAGVPASPLLMEWLARGSGTPSVKTGSYRIEGGMTPLGLLDTLARGNTIKESLTLIEGWNFAQVRAEMARQRHLRHDSAGLDDAQMLARVAPGYAHPEGLFYPDTYFYDRGSSDLLLLQQAHQRMLKLLDQSWAKRVSGLPYEKPYDALIMASIVEKETGREEDRRRVASVFVNRLRQGMLLQTDPTVIYGIGSSFDGNLRKQDLQTDTPYNTYLRPGLPPTPIAMPGRASLDAALNPAPGADLYFVARGDGSSEFSSNLDDHNRAVNRYQRGR